MGFLGSSSVEKWSGSLQELGPALLGLRLVPPHYVLEIPGLVLDLLVTSVKLQQEFPPPPSLCVDDSPLLITGLYAFSIEMIRPDQEIDKHQCGTLPCPPTTLVGLADNRGPTPAGLDSVWPECRFLLVHVALIVVLYPIAF